MLIGKFGRKFLSIEEYKEYVKSLRPEQVQSEYDYLGSQFTTKEIEQMFNYCKSALIHIQNNWSDTFK